MNRRITTVIRTSLVAGAMMMLVVPAAQAAISNPAAHPNKITVVVDGAEYTDGQDTLPGFDDNSCGPIPNSWPDYDANRVYYDTDDGVKFISWTEWDRLPGYSTWLKNHNASTDSGSGSGSGSTGSSGTAAPASTGSKPAPAPASTTTNAQPAVQDETPEEAPQVSASPEPQVSASPEAVAVDDADITPVAAAADDVVETAADITPAVNGQAAFGRILLLGLFVAGVATWLGYEVLRRRPQRSRA